MPQNNYIDQDNAFELMLEQVSESQIQNAIFDASTFGFWNTDENSINRIISAINKNYFIESIFFHGFAFCDLLIENLSHCLFNKKHLQDINFDQCTFQNPEYVIHFLSNCDSLKTISFKNISFTNHGIECILENLPNTTKSYSISLQLNEDNSTTLPILYRKLFLNPHITISGEHSKMFFKIDNMSECNKLVASYYIHDKKRHFELIQRRYHEAKYNCELSKYLPNSPLDQLYNDGCAQKRPVLVAMYQSITGQSAIKDSRGRLSSFESSSTYDSSLLLRRG